MATRTSKTTKNTSSGPNLESLITPIEDIDEGQVLLLYGKSGTGKTWIAGTFPKPILLIDIKEKGTATLRGVDGIDRLPIATFDQFYSEVNTDPKKVAYWMLAQGSKYRTIVIDQISNLQDMAMAHVRTQAKKKAGELFSQKNWGTLSGLLKDSLGAYKAMSDQYNQVWIAHERTFSASDEEEDDAIAPSVGARVMPSVGSFLDGAADIIGNTFVRENWLPPEKKGGSEKRVVEYCLRVGPHGYYTTKIRRPPSAGEPPEFITDPSYEKIMTIVRGETKKRKTLRRTRSGNR